MEKGNQFIVILNYIINKKPMYLDCFIKVAVGKLISFSVPEYKPTNNTQHHFPAMTLPLMLLPLNSFYISISVCFCISFKVVVFCISVIFCISFSVFLYKV